MEPLSVVPDAGSWRGDNERAADSDARIRLRKDFHLFRLLPRIVTDVQNLLDPDRRSTSPEDADGPSEIELVHLWGPDLGPIDAGVNHARELDKGVTPKA